MDRLTRRSVVVGLGRAAFGIAVFGVASACGSDEDSRGSSDQGSAPTTPAGSSASATDGTSEAPAPRGMSWQRVDLGFVSAWVVVRAGEAAVVDTGTEGSQDEIEAALAAVGLGWGDVSDVLLTHRHPDHVGSLPAVLAAATQATAWAGAADVGAITSPRPVSAVGNGDQVFGLDVIETPGHTPGHVSALDTASGVLFVGDALRGGDGGVIGPDPQYTPDMDTAMSSAAVLAERSFETALFGHGEPVLSGADTLVRDLVEA